MENRYKLPEGIQKKYLLELEKISHLTTVQLAGLFNITGRSYRDWKREKYAITQKAVEIIETKYNLFLHYSKDKALNLWKENKISAARKGGFATMKKYGGPGTPEGRRKGGIRGIAVLRAKGLIPKPKPFYEPEKHSVQLAEFVGIILGDGHIGKEQWTITLNSEKDKEYAKYVSQLTEKLFMFKPGYYKRKNMNAIVISGSGRHSIEYFLKLGLKIGNKVKQQVGVPTWINKTISFRIACTRGLIDTDGGIFTHRYKVNGKEYTYHKLCFVNRSLPLLNFVYGTLKMLGFNPKMIMRVENKRVWLYNQQEVRLFLKIVGSNNPRLYIRLKEGCQSGNGAAC